MWWRRMKQYFIEIHHVVMNIIIIIVFHCFLLQKKCHYKNTNATKYQK